MIRHISFAVLLMMIAGYLFVEVARWRRSRDRGAEALSYPVMRLVIRSVMAVLLVVLLRMAIYWEPAIEDDSGVVIITATLAGLFLLLLLDVAYVLRQFRRERLRRERDFAQELLRLSGRSR